MPKPHILIIEDELAIRDMIRFALTREAFELTTVENANQAKAALGKHIPNLILLDWMLPGITGIDLIHWLKSESLYQNIPIILLTAKAEEENKVKGLLTGADDYITKPFSPAELIARIKALLRRGPVVSPNQEMHYEKLVLNVDTHEVAIDKQSIDLTPIDYKLLHFFLTHQGKTYTRDQLLSYVWGHGIYHDDRTVDVAIRRLRDKLKPFGYHDTIKTVRGTGYQCVKK